MAYQSETGYTPTKLNASDYGITYDKDAIKKTFDDATAASYKTKYDEYNQTANQYYQQQYNNQQTALDTIRKSNAQAVATGASRGMQAANELSSILNLQQQGTTEATTLAADRNQIADEEQAAYAQNAVSALQQANTAGESVYSADTQSNVGQMQYYAAIEQALKNLEGVKYTADSNLKAAKYTADSNSKSSKYTADKNYEGNVYTANQNYAGTKYNADQNLAGTQYNANSNLAGTKYSADQNLSGQLAYANAYQNAAATSAAATIKAAGISAAAQTAAAAATGSGSTGVTYLDGLLQKFTNTNSETNRAAYVATLVSQGMSKDDANASWTAAITAKQQTSSATDALNKMNPTANKQNDYLKKIFNLK
jgi:hypothetical protein